MEAPLYYHTEVYSFLLTMTISEEIGMDICTIIWKISVLKGTYRMFLVEYASNPKQLASLITCINLYQLRVIAWTGLEGMSKQLQLGTWSFYSWSQLSLESSLYISNFKSLYTMQT